MQNSNLWLGLVGLGLVAILGGMVWFAQNQEDGTQITEVETKNSGHILGNPEATFTLIEYSDFQCPACATIEPFLQQLITTEDVKIIYRHFPLRSIHANALMAAQASEAAALQGKFAPMHQALFNSQKSWSNLSDPIDYFVILAGNIELDVERFKIDLVSNEVRQAVLDSEKIAKALQLSGTPTLFMNGRSIPNPRNYEELLKAVNNAKTN